MINQGVTAALAARDANTNGVDSHNSGTGARRNERATRECTYPDFMKCQPLNFKGTEGVVELTQWIEKMEIVTVGNDIAYAKTGTELKKKITDKYCPRTEIKKLKVKLWELKVKGTDVIGYNQRFQELALLYGRMFLEESEKIEKYVGVLPDMIHESVVASKPNTMQEATEIAIEVMDKRIRTFADRQTENKRKPDNNQQPQQHHQNKRQNTGRAYAAGTIEKKPYGGSKPLCSKCNYHHDGPCAPKCHKCNKVGHFARDCRSTANANNANHQRGTGSGQKPTCFECRAQGHFKRECPKLKNNKKRGNQVGGGNAPAKVYAVRIKQKPQEKRLSPSKHEHGNGRARKKPRGSYQSAKVHDGREKRHSWIPIGQNPLDVTHGQVRKHKERINLYSSYSQKKHKGVTITDCHAGNPCETI
ncbi:reverse transcriptase domain-containing protein [Tanacetum coccineum]